MIRTCGFLQIYSMKLLKILTILLVFSINAFTQNMSGEFNLPSAKLVDDNLAVQAEKLFKADQPRLRMREELIESIAQKMNFAKPKAATVFVPQSISSASGIKQALEKAAFKDPGLVQTSGYCDANFVGQPIRFTQTSQLILDDLLYQIHRRFDINFLMGDGIAELPINIRTDDLPWNVLLKSQLFLSGVRAKCIDEKTIELVKNDDLPKLQDTAEVDTKFIKLKFLQPSSGGNVDIAGRSNSRSSGGGGGQGGQSCGGGGQGGGGQSGGGSQGCGNFEKLIIEIEKILGIRSITQSSIGGGGQGGGGQGGQGETTEALRTNRSVSVIPGRNILVIRATEDELALINQIIEKADRAPFQVVIRGLVYTANDTRLRDIGVQTNIIAGTADGRTVGDFSGTPIPTNGTLFDFTTTIGTVDFNVQANALQNKGVISIQSRPFAMVIDGDTADLDVGRQIPVLIQSINSLSNTPGTLEILEAGNVLSVTPQVIDDDAGRATGVNLNLQLESNDVDTSVVSQGVPSVNRRSIQTRLLLNQETTVILGGFTVDTKSKDVSKTPGLGDIPILGYLFKRKVRRNELNRLYFAISVSVVPYGTIVEPEPNVSTDIPGVPPSVKKVEGETIKDDN